MPFAPASAIIALPRYPCVTRPRSRSRRHAQGLLQLALLSLQLLNLPLLRCDVDVARNASGIELHVDRRELALRFVDLALESPVVRFRDRVALAGRVQLGRNAVEIRLRRGDTLIVPVDLA